MQRLTCIFHLIVSYTAQLKADQMEGMIVGGEYANIIHHPHSAYFRAKCIVNGEKLSWTCGASIVNQKILLTAAHCMYECDSSSKMSARVGSEDRKQGQRYIIYSVVLHQGYKPKSTAYDIGLLNTEEAIMLSNKVSRVALMRNPPYYKKATVAGWGLVDEETELKDSKLKFLTQKVWKHSDCLKVLEEMPNGTICAAADSTTEYAAKGDSGSALVVCGYIQIGIVSFKFPEPDNYLVVYTDVGYYYDWIKHNSRNIYCY